MTAYYLVITNKIRCLYKKQNIFTPVLKMLLTLLIICFLNSNYVQASDDSKIIPRGRSIFTAGQVEIDGPSQILLDAFEEIREEQKSSTRVPLKKRELSKAVEILQAMVRGYQARLKIKSGPSSLSRLNNNQCPDLHAILHFQTVFACIISIPLEMFIK